MADADAPTLAQVAALAGVSPATASRAINGTARVSAGACRQVELAVRRLGYVRKRAMPARRSSPLIAVVVCEDSVRTFSDQYYPRVLWGIGRQLGDTVPLVVLMAHSRGQWRNTEAFLRGGHVDGALVINPRAHHSLELLAATRTPLVVAGRPLREPPLPSVDADNEGGAYAAVGHLVRTGRKAIATIAGPRDTMAGVDRLTGYRKAVADAGLSVSGLVGQGDFRQPSGEHAMSRLLACRPDTDAVFAASDPMAFGVLRALRRAGRRVPDDVAVIGFGDMPAARRTDPPLTTLRQPVEEIGARLARELLARIAGRGGGQVVLPTSLVLRDTA